MTFEPFDGPLTVRPRNRDELQRLLGDPSYARDPSRPDATWEKRNIVECHGDTAMPGSTSRFYFKVHRLIEPYAREALERCEEVAPAHVQRAGCYVYRRIRHAKTGPLSLHSYGAAIDINAVDNKAHQFKPGEYVEPWSPAWLRRWPNGVTPEIVAAFESCGFSWGGRWRGFCDPQHFEWVGKSDAKV